MLTRCTLILSYAPEDGFRAWQPIKVVSPFLHRSPTVIEEYGAIIGRIYLVAVRKRELTIDRDQRSTRKSHSNNY